MIIPSKSDVLILGIQPVSLAFASILSFCGLKVLVVDELKKPDLNSKPLNLSAYNILLLQHIGFTIEANSSQFSFVNQSLKLLATHLSNVIWDTQIIEKSENKYQLKHNNVRSLHESKFIYSSDDLIVDKNENELNFRNAFVLAWRLVAIVNETFSIKILSSYQKEKEIFQQYAAEKSQFQKIIEKLSGVKKTNIHLADSKINLHLSHKRELQAGDILPDLTFYDEQLKADSSLYNWCKYAHFSIMIFGYLGPTNLFSLARWLQLNYPIQLFYLPQSEKNESIFKALHIPLGEKKTIIIRPDRYIAFVNDTVDMDIIDNYLNNVLGMNAKAKDKV
jgi:hypothetical protein